jgi:hypothetical protein
MERFMACYGIPEPVQTDNGVEFTSRYMSRRRVECSAPHNGMSLAAFLRVIDDYVRFPPDCTDRARRSRARAQNLSYIS